MLFYLVIFQTLKQAGAKCYYLSFTNKRTEIKDGKKKCFLEDITTFRRDHKQAWPPNGQPNIFLYSTIAEYF